MWIRRSGVYASLVRILVIEDSDRLRTTLADGLGAEGYAVDTSADGRDGLASARAVDYDVIVLDLMLPEMDGLTVLSKLRALANDVPVLILSARDRVEHRVEGLRLGADDYLIKPFAFDELVARLEVLCRRRSGRPCNTVDVGPVSLDLGAKRFSANGTAIELAPREYAVLELLFLSAGRVLSRAEIEEHVYASDKQVWSNAVDSSIAAIRRALREAGVEDLVRTRRGLGYVVETQGAIP